MKLSLENNVTHKKYEYSVEDLLTSRLYFHFQIQIEEGMDEGEYSYFLYDDEKKNCFGQGLAQLGDYKPQNKKYKTNKNEIKQYNG